MNIRRHSNIRGQAFTLIELLVVIAIIGVLAALLFPVLSRAKQKAQGVLCLNAAKQMMFAITMYGGDHNDFFPPNPDDGNIIPGHNWCSGNAGIGGPQEFNPDVIKDPSRNLLIAYLAGNDSLFHCPGDRRIGVYQGTNPALAGHSLPAARTFSMNQAVGIICAGYDNAPRSHFGMPSSPVNGPWLNNQFNHRRYQPWRTFGKFSAIVGPGPASLWVLMDEDTSGLNDAAFAFGMERAEWIDVPAAYHNSGAGFAFADGHSEAHRWQMAGPKKLGPITDPKDLLDWEWMQKRTSGK